MNLKQLITTTVFLFSYLLQHASAREVEGMREWVNNKGQEITASLVSLHKEKQGGQEVAMITFKMKRGKDVTFPVSKLSVENQQELVEWMKIKPHGIASPSPPYSWPSQHRGKNTPNVVYEKFDEEYQAHLYKTAHFDFYIDKKISDSTVAKCVAVFDTIVDALDALPLALDTIPSGERPRYKAILVSSAAQYMKMGGLENSAGFFSPRQNLTVIPFKSLGIIQKGNKWVFDGKNRSFETLLHELTHQSTQHWYGMPPWFQEGLAEYISVMPYRSGRFLFNKPGRAIADKLLKYKPQKIPRGSLADSIC